MTLPTTRRGCRPAKNSAAEGTNIAFRRVLVIWKKTFYDDVVAANDEALLKLIRSGHESMKNVLPSHQAHRAALKQVCDALKQRKIKFKSVPREQIQPEIATGKYQLIVTVGGDGTVLDASHFNDNVPIVGVNSAEVTSHGHFCVANCRSFGSVLDEISAGARKPLKLLRLQLTLNGKPLPELVLNEMIVADPELGATSRYILHVGEQSEEQKSDGFFFGTAAGCTGWMHSYDAEVLPVESRQIQYIARGLIINPGQHFNFIRGLLDGQQRIRVVSQMVGGILKIDGKHIVYKFPRGSELEVARSEHDLLLYCERGINARYAMTQKATSPHAADSFVDRGGGVLH